MVERALSFGSGAAAYERFRPGYPDEVVDRIQAYAGRPVRTALEIGAGTGKATRVLAARGIEVTATDPDEAMLAELRRHVPPDVVTVHSSFEDLTPTSTYDLVFAAASLHWTDPGTRWSRVAALLGPGGVFASFGGPMSLVDPALEEAVRAVRTPVDAVRPPPPAGPEDPLQWPGTELVGSALFTDVRQCVIERRETIPARDYVDHLSTLSAYLVLDAPQRRRVLAEILAALPRQVHVSSDVQLCLARRA